MALSNPLDTMVATERELFEAREEIARLEDVLKKKDAAIRKLLANAKRQPIAEPARPVSTMKEAEAVAASIGFPFMMRGANTDVVWEKKDLENKLFPSLLPTAQKRVWIEKNVAECYRRARVSLAFEQENYAIKKQGDEYYKMRTEFHEAIRRVRSLAVEIADTSTGYEEP